MRALDALVGSSLKRIEVDALHAPHRGVELVADGRLLVVPEEISISTELHPHGDYARITFYVVGSDSHHGFLEQVRESQERARALVAPESVEWSPREIPATLAQNCGAVEEIAVLRTLEWLTPPEESEPFEILGVTIPAGLKYGSSYLHPGDKKTLRDLEALTDLAGVELGVAEIDCGISIRTQSCGWIVVYARGYALYTSIDDDLPAELEGVVEERLLTAKPA